MLVLATAFAVISIAVSAFMAPHRPTRAKYSAYESGISAVAAPVRNHEERVVALLPRDGPARVHASHADRPVPPEPSLR